MMWTLAMDLLLVFIGIGIGITLMCTLHVSKQADEQIEEMQRRDKK